MKKKIFNIVLVCAVLIGLFAGMTVTASAKDLSSNVPAGYDTPGQYPAGKTEDVYYYSTETKSNRKMIVYTPPGYSKDKNYPVVYAVHGINNSPWSIFADWCVYSGVLADNLIGQGKIQPVIIVAFDNNNVNSHNELFNNVMPYAESHYPIIRDADHRGIYGYSMGGGVTFAEGMGNLDTFHHVCPSSATPFNHPSNSVMFSQAAKQKIKTLVLSCGTIDWCGFYDANKASHDYCVATGFDHYWLSVPGGNHDGGVWKPAMWYFLQLAFPANGQVQVPTTPSNPSTVPGQTGNLKDGWYYIKNANAEKYLQVAGNKAASATNVELRSGDKSEGQKWYLENKGNGYVTLKSALGEFALDVNGGANKDDANIQIYNVHAGDAQSFMLKSASNGSYVITTKCSNLTKVLDDAASNKNEGANVCQWSYNGQANQQWYFEEVKTEAPGETVKLNDGWYNIKNVQADKYLQVTGNKAASSANVELRTANGQDGQKWYLKNVGDGYVTLKSALGEFMIDVNGGADNDDANIQIFNAYSGNAQQFMLKSSSRNGAYIVVTKCSALTKVLDDSKFSKEDGANVCQWTYGGQANQQWVFEAIK